MRGDRDTQRGATDVKQGTPLTQGHRDCARTDAQDLMDAATHESEVHGGMRPVSAASNHDGSRFDRIGSFENRLNS